MNDLIAITNEIATSGRKGIAKSIMGMCRIITPQFYRSQTTEEAQAERMSIELLTADIDNRVLAKMCELAVKGYAAARSENSKTYFDINYILTHYAAARREIEFEKIVEEQMMPFDLNDI